MFTSRKNDRGAVMVIAIVAVVMALAAAALGVDLGRVEVQKRSDQSVADLAALDAARAVGYLLNSTDQAGYNAAAQTAATKSATRNGFSGTGKTVTATVGSMDSNNNFSATGASAVKVVTTSTLKYAFQPGSKTLTATGVALVGSPIAAFSVGSTLASLDTSKSRLDTLLQGYLATSTNLAAVSYDGLAGSNLSLLALQTALLAQGLSVGTTQQLLDQSLTAAQLFQATATALSNSGKNVAAAEVNDIINAGITNTTKVKLGDLLDVATPSDSSALAAEMNVYQLVMTSAQVANGNSFVSVPLTGINLLGLAGVSLSASVISPAQTGIGPVGTTASNAQVSLKVTVNVGLGALLPVVNVTLTYTAGSAQGTLTSIVCGAAPSISVSDYASAVSVTGTGVTVLGNLGITGSVAQTAPETVTFSNPTEFSPSYNGKHIGATTSGVSLASVNVTGSGATAALAPLLQAALPTTLSTLDTALTPVIRPLLRALGVQVSQTDIEALGIYPSPSSCGGHPRLAQ